MGEKDIAGRFWLVGDIYGDVLTVRTSFDAAKATFSQGGYSRQ